MCCKHVSTFYQRMKCDQKIRILVFLGGGEKFIYLLVCYFHCINLNSFKMCYEFLILDIFKFTSLLMIV